MCKGQITRKIGQKDSQPHEAKEKQAQRRVSCMYVNGKSERGKGNIMADDSTKEILQIATLSLPPKWRNKTHHPRIKTI